MSTAKSKKSAVQRKRIYLDCAATTPLDKRVKKAMEPFFSEQFGNPSSIHTEGVAGKKALDSARTAVARCLEARADEIVFTGGGTEANNLAIHGVLGVVADRRRYDADRRGFGISVYRRSHQCASAASHVVTTNIEHASVLEPLRELELRGEIEATYVTVESNGIVMPEKIIAAIRPNTILVSVMYANNEIGTIQPIRRISQLIGSVKGQSSNVKGWNEKMYPLFHSDACQAPLYLRCLVNTLGVDLMTLDAHKIYGPKGVGCLYVRRGTTLTPQLLGGGQERGFRSTTENVPGIVGFAEALRIAVAEREKESARLEKLRNLLYFSILPARLRAGDMPASFCEARRSGVQARGQNTEIGKERAIVVNGSMKTGERLPNNLNISLPWIDTEFLTLQLDSAGIACSTKSSCLKDERESYVVAALSSSLSAAGRTLVSRSVSERARSALRLTLGRGTRESDIRKTAQALRAISDSISVCQI